MRSWYFRAVCLVLAMLALSTTARAQEEKEIRALVVLADEAGLRNATQIDQLVSTAATAGFNRLYAEVRSVDGVIYASAIEPMNPTVSRAEKDPYKNLLLPRAAAKELEVWPVFTTFPAYRRTTSARAPRGSLLARIPDGQSRTLAGDDQTSDSLVLADPGNAKVQADLTRTLVEFVKNYQPAGIVLKDFEFPDQTWGYNEQSLTDFRYVVGGSGGVATDDASWLGWRRAKLTQYLTDMCGALRAAKPGLKIGVMVSAAGHPPTDWETYRTSWPYSQNMQEWAQWAESGLIDQLIVLNHHRASDGSDFEGWLKFARAHQFKSELVVSVAGPINSAPDVLDQIRQVRGMGINVALWSWARPSRANPDAFFELAQRTLASARGGSTPPAPFVSGSVDKQFLKGNEPPPTVEMAETRSNQPTARPTPGGEPTPGPATPTPDATPNPEEPMRFQIVKLKNGTTMRAVVLERNEAKGQIVLMPAGGARMAIPISLVESVEDEPR